MYAFGVCRLKELEARLSKHRTYRVAFSSLRCHIKNDRIIQTEGLLYLSLPLRIKKIAWWNLTTQNPLRINATGAYALLPSYVGACSVRAAARQRTTGKDAAAQASSLNAVEPQPHE